MMQHVLYRDGNASSQFPEYSRIKAKNMTEQYGEMLSEMKISIVTVSFNGEAEIGRTIESVLIQNCDCLEYWIIDGASRDGTVEIAETFRAKMREKNIEYHIVSEPDEGIYDGMNKGAKLATGDVIGFLNCGDTYEAGALEKVQERFLDSQCDITVGNLRIIRKDGSSFIKKSRLRNYQTSRDWNHPTTFTTAALLKEYPFRKLGIHDDYGFYLQMVKQGRNIEIINEVLANFYMGGVSNEKSFRLAWKRIADRYRFCYRLNGFSRWYFLECIFMEMAKYLMG